MLSYSLEAENLRKASTWHTESWDGRELIHFNQSVSEWHVCLAQNNGVFDLCFVECVFVFQFRLSAGS